MGARPWAGLRSGPGRVAGRLLVADSWLLRDGRMRGLDRHRERFLRACGDCGGPPLERLVAFWRDMTAALPRTGEWFPRVELASGSMELRLLLRKAPPLGTGVRVWAAGQSDPRSVPRRKGPDLDTLARVRRRAAGEGAEEAVLIASFPAGDGLDGAADESGAGGTRPGMAAMAGRHRGAAAGRPNSGVDRIPGGIT